MSSLILASAFFLLIHFVVSGTRLRDALVARMKEGSYRGAFALASIIGLVWMSVAYVRAPLIDLWGQHPDWRNVAIPLMFVALVFVVIGLATPSPTRVGMEKKLAQDNLVRGMVRITRHPFLWGAALWAAVHVAVNGDLASLIFFGSFLVLALVGTTLIDAKRRRNFADQWERFARTTSNVPFGAIASGRNQLGPALREIGVWRLLIGVVVFCLVLVYHGKVFGPQLV